MNRKERQDREKEINAVSIFCAFLLVGLAILLFALPYINCAGLTSLVENLATPFSLALIFFMIDSMKDKYKSK